MKLRTIAAAALSLFAAACGPEVEPGPPDAPEVEFAEVEQGLGEAACATAPIIHFRGAPVGRNGRVVQMGADPHCSIASTTATSADNRYGTAQCPHQFIVEVQGVAGRAFDWTVDLPHTNLNSEGVCEVSFVNIAGYGRKNGVWSKLGERRLYGRWFEGGFLAGCRFVPDATFPQTLQPVEAADGYDRVRAVVFGAGLFIKQRVRGGVTYGSGPC